MTSRSRFVAVAAMVLALAISPARTSAADVIRDVVIEAGYAEVFAYDITPVAVILGDADIAIANVTVADVLVLTGRATGATNVIVLADDGREIDRFRLLVRRSGGVVAERRGLDRTVLRCDPNCRSLSEAEETPLEAAEEN